jgi:thioredoxin-dependent peroxiredoxin
MSKELQPGDDAPLFTTTAVGGRFGDGQQVSLGDFSGHPLVLYFYPRDNTPGCTTQACSLRDNWPVMLAPLEILGVSPDSAASHRKFINKYQLPFPLLVDEDKAITKAYGVWVEKSFLGVKHMGVERSTFIISPSGKIKAILRKVKPKLHVDQIREILQAETA